MMTDVHIHAPSATSVTVESHRCPVCKGDTPMLVHTYEWYDPHSTCLLCGDSWNGSVLQPRPFARGWRNQAIERARARARLHGLSLPDSIDEIPVAEESRPKKTSSRARIRR